MENKQKEFNKDKNFSKKTNPVNENENHTVNSVKKENIEKNVCYPDESKNDKINELQIQILSLKNELENKNNSIKSLENQIENLNNSLVSKVSEKANEAQQRLDEKIAEYQAKFDKEVFEIKKYALKDKIVDLIDIINNFELAVNNSPNNPEIQNYLKGFSMFSNMFKNYLADSGVKEIQINVNDEFDPNTMDPFETVEVKGVKPNLVTKIIKKGYKLHDRVVKHAIVQVSK